MKRSGRLPRHTPLARAPMRRRARKPSEFARIYGSRARVAWIKAQPCIACAALSPFFGAASAGKCDNAHTVTDGMGRKAGYKTIVPMCRTHHQRYDQHRAPFDTPAAREAVMAAAERVARAWDAHQERVA